MDGTGDNDVIVVGSGVIGLTTAVLLAERGRRVRVWAREAAERTTSAVAGALWWPYRIEPAASVGDWSLQSLLVYGELAERSEETGVRVVDGVMGETGLDDLGSWAAQVPGLRPSTRDEYDGPGVRARVPLIDMPVYLGWLRERLARAGGTVEVRTAGSLDEPLTEAPLVVNCSGIGARSLVPDGSVRPVRGQLVIVENPGVRTWFASATSTAQTSTYFFPQPGRLILGGTAQDDDWSLTPDPAVAEAIVKRCAAVRPEIAGARVLDHRVGLRPARPAVRIERELPARGRVLVHKYGHGGAGVTVAWGCAQEAAHLADEAAAS